MGGDLDTSLGIDLPPKTTGGGYSSLTLASTDVALKNLDNYLEVEADASVAAPDVKVDVQPVEASLEGSADASVEIGRPSVDIAVDAPAPFADASADVKLDADLDVDAPKAKGGFGLGFGGRRKGSGSSSSSSGSDDG